MESLPDNINCGRAAMEKIKYSSYHQIFTDSCQIIKEDLDSVSKEAHRVDEASSVNFLAQSGKPCW